MKIFSLLKQVPLLRTLILATLLLPLYTRAEERPDTRTRIFDPAFRTLKVSAPENFMAPPIIRLDTQDRLIFTFDELGDDRSDLCARLIHCNADWQPSDLIESEYLDGFNTTDIEDFGFSSNTFNHYVNYRIEIPSPQLSPVVSGNYLLQIYDRDNPDETLLQARFQVVEPLVATSGSITTRTDRGANNGWQQLGLRVSLKDYPVNNPYTDLKVSVIQNGRPESERFLAAPLRIEGESAVYEHQPALIFPALNEFRRFETVRASFPGMHVDSVGFIGNNYHAWLKVDGDRSEHEYIYDQTQHGRFLVREYNATDSDLGADYVTVHFTLDFPELIGAKIYVDGEFTNHLYDEAYRLQFDHDTRLYRLELPLKQGSYNYQYVVVPDSYPHSPADPAVVEGNKSETRNEYLVSVYHRPPGARADKLISFSNLEF